MEVCNVMLVLAWISFNGHLSKDMRRWIHSLCHIYAEHCLLNDVQLIYTMFEEWVYVRPRVSGCHFTDTYFYCHFFILDNIGSGPNQIRWTRCCYACMFSTGIRRVQASILVATTVSIVTTGCLKAWVEPTLEIWILNIPQRIDTAQHNCGVTHFTS